MIQTRRHFVISGLALAAGGPAMARSTLKSRGEAMTPCCPVVELRQYTLHPRKREEFIRLFETNFVAPQEALGIRLMGIFRDLDDPDRFVWMRGFDSMEARAPALQSFYSGPVWKAHRDVANPMMVDSDNVLLIQPANPGSGIDVNDRGSSRRRGIILAAIHYLTPETLDPFTAFHRLRIAPSITSTGGRLLGAFVSETAPNNFPRLPVRSSDHVHVSFTRFDNEDRLHASLARFNARSGWRDGAPESLLPAFMRKPELIRLSPTGASRLG